MRELELVLLQVVKHFKYGVLMSLLQPITPVFLVVVSLKRGVFYSVIPKGKISWKS